jgi:hypothetical protein
MAVCLAIDPVDLPRYVRSISREQENSRQRRNRIRLEREMAALATAGFAPGGGEVPMSSVADRCVSSMLVTSDAPSTDLVAEVPMMPLYHPVVEPISPAPAVIEDFGPPSFRCATAQVAAPPDETVEASVDVMLDLPLYDWWDFPELMNDDNEVPTFRDVATQAESSTSVDSGTQTASRTSALDFCSNRATQTSRILAATTGVQTEPQIGAYVRQPLPGGLRLNDIAGAVIANPLTEPRMLARQLAAVTPLVTTERSFAELENLVDVAAATIGQLMENLANLEQSAAQADSSGFTGLMMCREFLGNFTVRRYFDL